MKQTIKLLTPILLLIGCTTHQPVQNEKNVPQDTLQQETEQKSDSQSLTNAEKLKTIEEKLSSAKDTELTAKIFSMFYLRDGASVCDQGVIPSSQPLENTKDIQEIFDLFAIPGIKTECHIVDSYYGEYQNTSDECILERRNAKKSLICHFNYKKYLPETSSISRDEEFIDFIETFNALYSMNSENQDYECTFCKNLKEKTTAEKEECEKQAKNFLQQIVENKVPLCKNKANKKYMDFLKEGVERFSFLSDLTTTEINYNATSPTGAFLMQGMYQNAYQEAWKNAIKNFGIENFCSIKGYEADIAQINKFRKKSRNNGVVSLN